MPRPSLHSVALVCHATTPTQVILGMRVSTRRVRSGALALTFSLHGHLTQLRVPTPATPRRAGRLWEHTCFEAFVAVAGESAYHEFNFSPSGEWAVYSFRSYREGVPLAQELTPEINVRYSRDRIELDAVLGLNHLVAIEPRARLRLALSAVIEDDHGALSYWALKHPPGKPDFHHPEAFALELDSPV